MRNYKIVGLFWFAIIICSYAIIRFISIPTIVTLLQIALFSLYFINIIVSIKKFGVFSASSLFLYSFFLFLLSRILLDFLGIKSMFVSDRFAWYIISNQTTVIVLFSYIIFLGVFLVGLLVIKAKNYTMELKNDKNIENLSQYILFFTLPFALIGCMKDLMSVLNKGYLSVYLIDNSSLSIIDVLKYIFILTIPIYICSKPQNNERKILYVFIIFIYIIDGLKGARGEILRPFVFFIWLLFINDYKFSFKKIFVVICSIPILSAIITFIREDNPLAFSISSLVNLMYSLGGTHMVFANYIDYRTSIVNDTNWYFLSGILNPISRYITNIKSFTNGRTYELAASSFSLDHKLTYTLSPIEFSKGRGFGSNLVTEFYAFFGFIGIIILTSLLVYLIFRIEKKACTNRFYLVFSFYWIQTLVWSPRGTMFPDVVMVGCTMAIFLSINFLSLSKRNKKRLLNE